MCEWLLQSCIGQDRSYVEFVCKPTVDLQDSGGSRLSYGVSGSAGVGALVVKRNISDPQ